MSLPSRHQIDDIVVCNFGSAGIVWGTVTGVIFGAGIVNYDIEIYPFPDDKESVVLLRNVRGYYVEGPQDRFAPIPPEATNGFNGMSNIGIVLFEN